MSGAPDKHIRCLCIIGVGLIGGSLARAARGAGCVGEIVGVGRDEAHLQRAQALGVVDRYETAIEAGVAGADMVVVAVPVGAMEAVFRAMAPHLAADAVVTDVGSVKGAVVEAARAGFGELPAWFVPGHPIAGTERSGVEASFAELFQQRVVLLTPTAASDPQATEQVRWLWQQAGAEVVVIDVDHHDQVLAATSHLPHLLAYGLVDTLARMDDSAEVFRFAAGGFRDFTRIASSDPRMWHDICLANRHWLLVMLDRFRSDLDALEQALARGDGQYLLDTFARAKRARDTHCGLWGNTEGCGD